jgi:hypothetical protein
MNRTMDADNSVVAAIGDSEEARIRVLPVVEVQRLPTAYDA